MRVLGLTGSAGMGKTTVANIFRTKGVPIWNADEAVSELYGEGGGAVKIIQAIFGDGVINPLGAVDRKALRAHIEKDPKILDRLEHSVHPLVRDKALDFVKKAKKNGAPLAVLEIPLLFENGLERIVDAVAVATAPHDVQMKRLKARASLNAKQLEILLSRQLLDSEKRGRADFVVHSISMESAEVAVDNIISTLVPGSDSGE